MRERLERIAPPLLALSLLLGSVACSGEEQNSDQQIERAEIEQIMEASSNNKAQSYYFEVDDLVPLPIEVRDNSTIFFATSRDIDPSSVINNARIFVTVQRILRETIESPSNKFFQLRNLNSPSSATNEIPVQVSATNYDSLVVFGESGDFRSNLPDSGLSTAFTFNPQSQPSKSPLDLKRTITFISPRASEYTGTLDHYALTAIESCQSAANLVTSNPDGNFNIETLAAQEAYCNSLGRAMVSALNGVPYEKYMEWIMADTTTVAISPELSTGLYFVGKQNYADFAEKKGTEQLVLTSVQQ